MKQHNENVLCKDKQLRQMMHLKQSNNKKCSLPTRKSIIYIKFKQCAPRTLPSKEKIGKRCSLFQVNKKKMQDYQMSLGPPRTPPAKKEKKKMVSLSGKQENARL